MNNFILITMHNRITIITLLLFSVSNSIHAQLPPSMPEYHLVFQDEFDTLYPNTIINDTLWARTPEWNQNSNKTGSMSWCITGPDTLWDRAYIIRDNADSSTIKINNGTCKLSVNQNFPAYSGEVWNWPVCDSTTGLTISGQPCTGNCYVFQPGDTISRCFKVDTLPFKYTTGMLYSKQKFKYGYFEIRFKLPPSPTPPNNHQGFGPNFWLFRADIAAGNWWSEIDIFEINSFNSAGPDHNRYSSTVHYSNKDSSWHPSSHVEIGNISDNTWHTAAGWWTPNFIKTYYDGTEILSVQNDPSIPTDSLVPMHLIIDINSPASNYCTNFDTLNTQFPYIYEIDYVKVYQLDTACSTDRFYCNVTPSAFESKLYKSLTIGGTGCIASIDSGASISGLGNDFVLLEEGLMIDSTSQAYFDVLRCDASQYFGLRLPASPVQPPPVSWLRKFHYK